MMTAPAATGLRARKRNPATANVHTVPMTNTVANFAPAFAAEGSCRIASTYSGGWTPSPAPRENQGG